MNVLSLFDGMSCGQQALEKSNIQIDNYFASEIDKYAIKVTQANYPKTKQLGSVINVDGYSLPRIDLLLGGSPCQSFSFAGRRKGMSTKDQQEILTIEHYLELKSEGFEFEGQSYLFWEYIRLLKEVKPKYFLLENVMMGDKWEKILSKAIGVNPIEINSSLVSAQNRRRLYWTNIGMIPWGLFGDLESIIQQPKDKGILLKDILEDNMYPRYKLSDVKADRVLNTPRGIGHFYNKDSKKIGALISSYSKQPTDGSYIEEDVDDKYYLSKKALKLLGPAIIKKSISKDKSMTIDSSYYKGVGIRCGDCRQVVEGKREVKQLNASLESGGYQPYPQNRVYDINGLNPALTTLWNGSNLINTTKIRRLTPLECERLQTVKDNYTNHVSDTQRYKMLGNGWTVDVISHILNHMK
tara:strand:- start:2378 stop:3610 length:1233 start_codon:yes stop_codon:yes gene_type:complete